MTDKYKDGRRWQYNTTSRQGFSGIRKIGKCQGSYRCQNSACSFFLEKGFMNDKQFRSAGGVQVCFVCGVPAHKVTCGAIKVVEFPAKSGNETHTLKIFHHGKHMCSIKRKAFNQQKAITNHPDKGPKGIAKATLKEAFNAGASADELGNIAYQFTDRKRISNQKAKILGTTENNSIDALVEFKKYTDKKDTYYVYRINSRKMNNEPTYVFKTSRKKIEMALQCDREGNFILSDEPVHFDAKHSRVKGFKTLTLWVYHPVMRRVINLASMDVEKEKTEHMTIFWRMWDKCLQQVKNDPSYQFNPKYFICDEAGANFNAIEEVYGKEARKRVYTCQWHFKNCRNRQEPLLDKDDRDDFIDLTNTLCMTTSANIWTDTYNKLMQIATRNPAIKGWLQWWYSRRGHVFPAYRPIDVPLSNLAEVGHSSLGYSRKETHMSLIEAARDDVAQTILLEEEISAFYSGDGGASGRGPNQAEARSRKRKAEMKMAREFGQQVLKQGVNWNLETDNNTHTLPPKRSKHRAPQNVIGKKGNKEKSAAATTSVAPTSPVASTSAAATPAPTTAGVSTSKSTLRVTIPNPPIIVRINNNIKVCHGCKVKFTENHRKPPKDIIFTMKDFRLIPDYSEPGQKKWKKSEEKKPCYYHLSMRCLRLTEGCETLEKHHVYMWEETKNELTREHIQYLEKLGFWEYVN